MLIAGPVTQYSNVYGMNVCMENENEIRESILIEFILNASKLVVDFENGNERELDFIFDCACVFFSLHSSAFIMTCLEHWII